MRLAINIDHIATLRNARGGSEPDPVKAALLCEEAGAVGIVCHLREDRRHINDNDVIFVLNRRHILSDLFHSAERNYPYNSMLWWKNFVPIAGILIFCSKRTRIFVLSVSFLGILISGTFTGSFSLRYFLFSILIHIILHVKH